MGCVHRHSSSSPEPAYVSVGCTLHACPATHPCPWTFISVLRSGWFDFAIWAPWHIHPMPANLSRVPGSVRACGRRLSHRCLLFVLQKNASQLPAKMLLAAFKKRKKQMHGRAGTERGAPANTRALDNPKTAADRKHERSQACRRQLHGGDIVFPRTSARVLAIDIAQVRSWREGGSAR